MASTMRVPRANILRELPAHDQEWGARGDTFAGSMDERMYAATVLGRAIGHAADMETQMMTSGLRALADMGLSADTDADIAAAGSVTRWQAYATLAAFLRPATATFAPSLRLAVAAAAACPPWEL